MATAIWSISATNTGAGRIISSAGRWQSRERNQIHNKKPRPDRRGFFVEVGADDGKGQAVVLRSFSDSEPLDDYAQGFHLPGE
jgi:hypothetical protein